MMRPSLLLLVLAKECRGLSSVTAAPRTISTTKTLVDDQDYLEIAGKRFSSRLLLGTGKYRSQSEMVASVVASEAEIVTVAVRRIDTSTTSMLADKIDWNKVWMLPNTAGCTTAEDAIEVAHIGRAIAQSLGQEDNNFIKLEVIPDPKYLLPDPIGTLVAAKRLVDDGFAVLPYCSADPILCRHLEDVGCATVMPLGSPIGSGQGIDTASCIKVICENANVPVVVDAGLRTPSDACLALEMGADAVLANSAVARAEDSVAMATAFKLAVRAGRLGYRANFMDQSETAVASSPMKGLPLDYQA